MQADGESNGESDTFNGDSERASARVSNKQAQAPSNERTPDVVERTSCLIIKRAKLG